MATETGRLIAPVAANMAPCTGDWPFVSLPRRRHYLLRGLTEEGTLQVVVS